MVVSVDNRGTPAPRGRAWRKCVYGKVGILAPREQAEAITALEARWPFIDRKRVGIWGWSGGGSMTLDCIFRYPDLYQTGIAIAFVADQRYYDTIYQERYMGLPADNPEGYKQGSPITHAGGLKGNLLLIHGTGDDNVHYQNCEALVESPDRPGQAVHDDGLPQPHPQHQRGRRHPPASLRADDAVSRAEPAAGTEGIT